METSLCVERIAMTIFTDDRFISNNGCFKSMRCELWSINSHRFTAGITIYNARSKDCYGTDMDRGICIVDAVSSVPNVSRKDNSILMHSTAYWGIRLYAISVI